MRKSIKKLNLSRETVRALEGDLEGAVGGSTVPGCVSAGCPTAVFPCKSANLCATVVYPCVTQTGCIGTQNC
ncbi:MAG TPA: hypothetical protein VN851_11570 [Thermoanaerobaculia bacterium]|nr:hypothetical protein [Thermoanaerobaculia bacterium]